MCSDSPYGGHHQLCMPPVDDTGTEWRRQTEQNPSREHTARTFLPVLTLGPWKFGCERPYTGKETGTHYEPDLFVKGKINFLKRAISVFLPKQFAPWWLDSIGCRLQCHTESWWLKCPEGENIHPLILGKTWQYLAPKHHTDFNPCPV